MRLGIVSDIHCNIQGLERALDLMAPFDQLWCAGDSVFQFRWSNDVVRRLRELDAVVVLGNHEETILGPDGQRALSNPKVDQELVAWLRQQPYRVERVVDGKKVVMTHGSPWEPWKEYHYPHEPIWGRAAELECDALIVGHTHYKMALRVGRVLVINPGSAGDPRDHRNDFQLSCATWDTTTGEVVFYDYPDPTRHFVRHSGEQ
ncbi:metallophosphoesterase [Tepidiforma sp.]|uniref:metallophosphoesterase family protein n=1 Tax=Tepidiforma sp. TaxID=2682230 RepID=UPI002629AC76|nr:YfcE family phosphodiesterase [Tepidiforma sp.]MCX7617109.1 YfcE family phosphodiesterase [Tepidiforma sp.]